MVRLPECRMANPIFRASGAYAVAVEEAEDSEVEPTMVRLPEHVVAVDRARKVLRALRLHRLEAANAPQEFAWYHRFLRTEFLSQHSVMPVRDFKTICHF